MERGMSEAMAPGHARHVGRQEPGARQRLATHRGVHHPPPASANGVRKCQATDPEPNTIDGLALQRRSVVTMTLAADSVPASRRAMAASERTGSKKAHAPAHTHQTSK